MKKLFKIFSNSSKAGDNASGKRKGLKGPDEVMPGELFNLYDKVLFRPKDIADRLK